MSKVQYIVLISSLVYMLSSCSTNNWTSKELKLINTEGPYMRVLTIDNPDDSLVLRKPSKDFSEKALLSDDFALLREKMISTVQSPQQNGVGIAGPQVGLNRRVVAVQRFDKEGKPFEVYPNIRIIDKRGELVPGAEGCLSVPNRRGKVLRYREIDIAYTVIRKVRADDLDANTVLDSDNIRYKLVLENVVETVKGFTAVIFQHECDHLDGVLYIDRL